MMKRIVVAAVLMLAAANMFAGAPESVFEGALPGVSIDFDAVGVKVDGEWITASAFPKREWKTLRGEEHRLSLKEAGDGAVEVHELVCSGRAPLKDFRLRIERVENRSWLVLGATVTAEKDFELGGFHLLAGNFPMVGNSDDWTVFLESLRAPNFGRIIRPAQVPLLAGEKSRKKNKLHDAAWVTTLQDDAHNRAFAFAALQGELWPTMFHWAVSVSGNGLALVVRSGSEKELEKIVVPAGRMIVADPVLAGHWDDRRPTQALLKAGQVMGRNVRKGRPMRRPDPGWSTWHSYGRAITEEGVMAAAACMRDQLADAGWRMIQLDGGWWVTQGSYVVNTNFPHGIGWLSDQVTSMGLEFGLHISPFRVSPKDEFWKTHADWILNPYGQETIDPNDEDMVTTIGAVYLDGSHPDVAPYLAAQFRQMVKDYRPVFMKWDHHYGSLAEAPRHDPTMTGLQAHNRTVRRIRAALPDDLIITRSMGWLYGAIECYDAVRIGNDINHPGIRSEEEPYANMTYGKTSGTIDNVLLGRDYKGLIRFARSAAQNYYIHNNIAICDPDAFFTSPQYTLEEARCHITVQALMGGLLFGGDRIESLPPERLALYKHRPLLDLWKEGKHAIPLDLFSGADVPRIWKVELEGRTVFGLFNWIDEATETAWSLTDLELEPGNYKLTDLWSGKPVELTGGKLTLRQEPHTVRLLEFRK